MKYVIILAIGVGIGYGYGFNDAQVNRKNIVSRIVDRVGGSNRKEFTNDIDDRMDKASSADRPGR
jgi:hypothetical protein